MANNNSSFTSTKISELCIVPTFTKEDLFLISQKQPEDIYKSRIINGENLLSTISGYLSSAFVVNNIYETTEITKLCTQNITTELLCVNNTVTEVLCANNITTELLCTETITTKELSVLDLSVRNLTADYVSVNYRLCADEIYANNLSANNTYISNLTANDFSVIDLSVRNLTADYVSVNYRLCADEIYANNLSANNYYISILSDFSVGDTNLCNIISSLSCSCENTECDCESKICTILSTMLSDIIVGDGETLCVIYNNEYNDYSTKIISGGFDGTYGPNCRAIGISSIATGSSSTAVGDYSHAEGINSITEGQGAHAEGTGCNAAGNYSHAEGELNEAIGIDSHAEGYNTNAKGDYSHAAGINADANDEASYVWNGDEERDPYESHGKGTFNINPIDGISGFYIGDKNLAEYIKSTIVNVLNNYTSEDGTIIININGDNDKKGCCSNHNDHCCC